MNDLSFRPLGQGSATLPVRALIPTTEPAIAPPPKTKDGQLGSDDRPPPKPLLVLAPTDEPTGPPPTFATNVLEAEAQNRLHPALDGQSTRARRAARTEAATNGYRLKPTRLPAILPTSLHADLTADSLASGPSVASAGTGSPVLTLGAIGLKL